MTASWQVGGKGRVSNDARPAVTVYPGLNGVRLTLLADARHDRGNMLRVWLTSETLRSIAVAVRAAEVRALREHGYEPAVNPES